ncbi:MAG: NUDIX hydrolase [Patescibacteria group bacterium]
MSDLTPVASVGIVVFAEDSVLLVRHEAGAEHLINTYGLPSGRLEEGETYVSAAKRELAEETGLITAEEDLMELPEKYTAEIPRKDGTTRLFFWIVFLCKAFSGELTVSNETSPEWVKMSDIKKHQLLPNIENAISQALRFRKEI